MRSFAAEAHIHTGIGDGSLLSIEAICRKRHSSHTWIQFAFPEHFGPNSRIFPLSTPTQRAQALMMAGIDQLKLSKTATHACI